MAPHLCCWPSVYIGPSPAVRLGRLKKLSKRDLAWISVQKSSISLLPMPGLPMSTAQPKRVSHHTQEGPGAPGLSAPLTPAATGLEQSASVLGARQAGFQGALIKAVCWGQGNKPGSLEPALQGVPGLAQGSTRTPDGPGSTAHGRMC